MCINSQRAGIGSALLLAPLLLSSWAARATDAEAARTTPPWVVYGRFHRFDDAVSAPADAATRHGWAALKYLPLGEGSLRFLSLGGELREKYESDTHSGFGLWESDSDDYLLQRFLIHGDLHLEPSIRVFVQLGSHLQIGREQDPAPLDVDRLDLQQGFADLRMTLGAWRATARAGRQELAFGAQRFVSVRDGPNVRQSFDGLRLFFERNDLRVDAFVSRPVAIAPGEFDDHGDSGRRFFGVYGATRIRPAMNLDAYYFDLDARYLSLASTSGHDHRQSFGLRLWGRLDAFDYDIEAIRQLGSFEIETVEAWSIAADVGYTLARPHQPRLGARYFAASGDRDPSDKTAETFHPLFPRGSYLSAAGAYAPTNLVAMYASASLELSAQLNLTLQAGLVRKQTAEDAFYALPITPLPGSTTGSRSIGRQYQAQLVWTPLASPSLEIDLEYDWIDLSAAFARAGGRNLTYVSVYAALKF